jgi:hypothetical protein
MRSGYIGHACEVDSIRDHFDEPVCCHVSLEPPGKDEPGDVVHDGDQVIKTPSRNPEVCCVGGRQILCTNRHLSINNGFSTIYFPSTSFLRSQSKLQNGNAIYIIDGRDPPDIRQKWSIWKNQITRQSARPAGTTIAKMPTLSTTKYGVVRTST